MPVRRCVSWVRSVRTLTLGACVCGTALGGVLLRAGEPRPMPVVEHLPAAESANSFTSLASSAVPLPPRDVHAKPRAPRADSTATVVTQTVIDIVVTSPKPADDRVPIEAAGWTASGAARSSAGRVQLESIVHAEPAPLAPSDLSADINVAVTGATNAAWTVVESTDPRNPTPLLEAGVMRSDAVFDGIPVLTGELAPLPICEGDAALLQSIAQFYALAPLPLEDRPALAAPSVEPACPPDFTALTPYDTAAELVDTAAVPAPAAVEIDAAARSRIDDALVQLQRPLNSISLSTGLREREPPDLASVAEPAGQPHVVWGAPWPDVKLASKRYTVPQFHQPLYFEQANFERCGTSWWFLSPYVSAANFAGNVVLLPVHAVLQPPCSCQQSLGDCPTCERYPLCPRCFLNQ